MQSSELRVQPPVQTWGYQATYADTSGRKEWEQTWRACTATSKGKASTMGAVQLLLSLRGAWSCASQPRPCMTAWLTHGLGSPALP